MFLRRSSSIIMFPEKETVIDPRVIIRRTISTHEFTFVSEIREGVFYRVIPSSSREVYYIQMLLKNVDVSVPEEGDGLILSSKAINNCDNRR